MHRFPTRASPRRDVAWHSVAEIRLVLDVTEAHALGPVDSEFERDQAALAADLLRPRETHRAVDDDDAEAARLECAIATVAQPLIVRPQEVDRCVTTVIPRRRALAA